MKKTEITLTKYFEQRNLYKFDLNLTNVQILLEAKMSDAYAYVQCILHAKRVMMGLVSGMCKQS